MALETGTYISDLNVANPTSADPKSEGDDHLRLLKASIKNTFPNVDGAVTASPAELNILDGATLDTAELNVLDGMRADTAELNILNGATMTTVELNYIDGVTSPIQPQIDLKAPIASPTLTGTPRAPTAPAATSGTQIATLDFVNSTILTASLPGQAGNAGALLSTDGANANWTKTIDGSVVKLTGKGDLVGTSGDQLIVEKRIFQRDNDFSLGDNGDITKLAKFECSAIATGTTRIITIPNEDITLGDPPVKLLQTFTSPGGAEWEVLPTIIDNRYDVYEFVFHSLVGTGSTNLGLQFKAGGAYITTSTYYTYAGVGTFTYGFLTNDMPSPANSCFGGTIKFFTPWSAAFKKYCYASIANSADVGTTGTGLETTEGKISNSSLLALQGFKLACFSTAGTITAGAIGKWYGYK